MRSELDLPPSGGPTAHQPSEEPSASSNTGTTSRFREFLTDSRKFETDPLGIRPPSILLARLSVRARLRRHSRTISEGSAPAPPTGARSLVDLRKRHEVLARNQRAIPLRSRLRLDPRRFRYGSGSAGSRPDSLRRIPASSRPKDRSES